MTLVWGRPLVDGGAVVTGELADLAVDQCPLLEGRFTLHRARRLPRRHARREGLRPPRRELAHESLYTEDDDEDDEDG